MPPSRRGRSAALLLALLGWTLLPAVRGLAAEQRPAPADDGHAPRDDATLERETLERTLESVPSGESRTWRNPASGDAGRITPLVTYRTTEGQFCREFRESVTAAAGTRESRRTACRRLDGRWQIVPGE